jgi:hypothetical protein
MSSSCLLVLLAATSLILPSTAWAQRRALNLESLDVEQLIRIRTVNHGVHIGRLTGLTSDSLFLRPERGSNAVEVAAIDQLWVRGTAYRKGAVIGGVTGAVLRAVSFALLSCAFTDGAGCAVDMGAIGIGVFTGGVVGSITGAVFGAIFGQWHQEYP